MLVVIIYTIDNKIYATVMFLNLRCHSPNDGFLAPVINIGTHFLMAHYVNNTNL